MITLLLLVSTATLLLLHQVDGQPVPIDGTSSYRPVQAADFLSSVSTDIYDLVNGYIWQSCGYKSNYLEHAKKLLTHSIAAQDEGIQIILQALTAWHFQRERGENDEPLVLSISGPTGVGKSETAYRLAEALFPILEVDGEHKPCGLLMLRGEEYSNHTALARQGLSYVREYIETQIVTHLKRTGGQAIIVLDEVQKIAPGVLELFLPLLERRGRIKSDEYVSSSVSTLMQWSPFASSSSGGSSGAGQRRHRHNLHSSNNNNNNNNHHNNNNKKKRKTTTTTTTTQECNADHGHCETHFEEEDHYEDDDYEEDAGSPQQQQHSGPAARGGAKTVVRYHSTKDVVFVFISDIGLDRLIQMLFDYGDRKSIPKNILRSVTKQFLDEQWKSLEFGKTIKEVVPYFPLEIQHVQEVMRFKLRDMSQRGYAKQLWMRLLVSPGVVSYLSGRGFIDYQLISSKTKDEKKVVASRGARALVNAGPLMDLNRKIPAFILPHRPGEIFHVGIITADNFERTKTSWKNSQPLSKKTQLFFQWCKADPCLLLNTTTAEKAHSAMPNGRSNPASKAEDDIHSKYSETICKTVFQQSKSLLVDKSSNAAIELGNRFAAMRVYLRNHANDEIKIADDYAFSNLCETLWYGSISD